MKLGGNIGLEVFALSDQLLVPLVEEQDVPEPYESPSKFVDYSSWKLVGVGQPNPTAFKALYYAPSTPPARNPVAVTIKLNGPTIIDGKPYGELWLVSTLYVGDEGITYRINGGKWVNTKVGPNMFYTMMKAQLPQLAEAKMHNADYRKQKAALDAASDFHPLLKKQLQAFVSLCDDVDFGAKLYPSGSKQYFVNPAYQRNPRQSG